MTSHPSGTRQPGDYSHPSGTSHPADYSYPSGQIWTPNEATSATMRSWHDANDLASFNFSSGSSIESWTDIEIGWEANQLTVAKQPTYEAAGLVGKPCVFFDGTDDVLGLPAAYAAQFAGEDTPFSVWVVMRLQSLAVGVRAWPWALGNTTVATQTYSTCAAGDNFTALVSMRRRGDAGAEVLQQAGTVSSGENLILSYDLDGGTQCRIEKQNVTLVNAALNVGVASFDACHIGGVQLGATVFASGLPFRIGELQVWSQRLSDAERALNLAYLKAKWGI